MSDFAFNEDEIVVSSASRIASKSVLEKIIEKMNDRKGNINRNDDDYDDVNLIESDDEQKSDS